MIKKICLFLVLFLVFSCNESNDVKQYTTVLDQTSTSKKVKLAISEYPYDTCEILYDSEQACKDNNCHWNEIEGCMSINRSNTCEILYDNEETCKDNINCHWNKNIGCMSMNRSMLASLIFPYDKNYYLAVKLDVFSMGLIGSDDLIDNFQLFCDSFYWGENDNYRFVFPDDWDDDQILTTVANTQYSDYNYNLKLFEGNAQLSVTKLPVRLDLDYESMLGTIINDNVQRWMRQLKLVVNDSGIKNILTNIIRSESKIGRYILFNIK
tara:strand:- start:33 stop:833 length:801 start_codon:yes stop_codon:yes gene_type:complete